ncbi:MAG: dihydroorotase [Chloroflexi bacterium]|nr:dihydroorotase [Chloroflexota bacterium]
MEDILVRGGHIIDVGQNIDFIGDLLIREGKVAEVGAGGLAGAAEKAERGELRWIDASGCIVCPGFIDLHVHLREPGDEDKETIATGTRAAAAGGFTTVACMPNTNPPIDNRSTVEYVLQVAKAQGVVKVLPIAAITKKRGGEELTEVGELVASGVVAFSDDGKSVASSRIMRYALAYSSMFGVPISSHCQDEELTKGGVMNEGIIATRLGLKGMPAAAEEDIVARDIALAQLTDGCLHIAHVSTAGAVDLIRRAKAAGLAVTAEVTPHHLTLTEDWVAGVRRGPHVKAPYDTNTKVNPPLRTAEDVAALIDGLKDGTIDAVATDHAPHTIVDKLCEYDLAEFGISGLETALGCLLTLFHERIIDLRLIVEKLTFGPAQAFNLSCGTLKPGSSADVVIFDPNEEWVVDPSTFQSKGHNTPLAGLTLRGRAKATLVEGRVVFQAKEELAYAHTPSV